jgi:phosphonate transport system ATP-binding protein
VIVGLSGAGKSTLIRAINGLVPLTSGRLVVNGHDVPNLNRKGLRALRSEVGMIFQGFNLVDRTTVLNNVLMGRLHERGHVAHAHRQVPRGDIQVAARALQRVEILDRPTCGPRTCRAASVSGSASPGRWRRSRR